MPQAQLAASGPSVSLIDNRPATTSLDIAKFFGKDHGKVIRDIRNLLESCPTDFTEANFGLSDFTDPTGRKLPMYTVFFDGFMLLVMGYTGKKALGMKLAYIGAFNAMRDQLEGKPPAPALESPEERKRRLGRERLRRFRERERERKALPTTAAVLDERAQKVQSLVSDVKERGNEFMSSVFTLYNALRLRPVVLDPLVPDLARALEHNLPQFCTAIGMNVSALSDMLEVYGATLKAAK